MDAECERETEGQDDKSYYGIRFGLGSDSQRNEHPFVPKQNAGFLFVIDRSY